MLLIRLLYTPNEIRRRDRNYVGLTTAWISKLRTETNAHRNTLHSNLAVVLLYDL